MFGAKEYGIRIGLCNPHIRRFQHSISVHTSISSIFCEWQGAKTGSKPEMCCCDAALYLFIHNAKGCVSYEWLWISFAFQAESLEKDICKMYDVELISIWMKCSSKYSGDARIFIRKNLWKFHFPPAVWPPELFLCTCMYECVRVYKRYYSDMLRCRSRVSVRERY